MKKTFNIFLIIVGIFFAQGDQLLSVDETRVSLRRELEQSINHGLEFLVKQQQAEGYWGRKNLPSYTALVLTALQGQPIKKDSYQKNIAKGYQWLLSQQQKDGGIYSEGLATYNTSISLLALVAAKNKNFDSAILKARKFVVGLQQFYPKDNNKRNDLNGGIGYGGTYKHSDMSNTYWAIQGLKASEKIARQAEQKQPQLNWQAVREFITSCQNVKSKYQHEDASNDGGFVYFPGNSKAGFSKGKIQKLRSYGSISYAGLLSLIYADVKKNDYRVKAVLNWVKDNFTLEENPGMGLEGLYYYYQAIAKALTAAKINHLTIRNQQGKVEKIDWRKVLASKILSIQKADGSWQNSNSRWQESNPILVTSYMVLALEYIYYGIVPAEKR